MINKVIGEKRIDLFYPIKNFDSRKEVAIVSLVNDNIQYKFMKPWIIKLKSGIRKQQKELHNSRRELIDLVKGKIELTQFEKILE